MTYRAACGLARVTHYSLGLPDLHFGGACLERSGFAVGQRVRVYVGKD